ncbi:MAG: hypothetical protein RO009_17110 [Pseudorhodoplanes sp.]|jgi:hypothetical protein|nr:hypothetical protein [Pseudorhodoplanes sp.]
MFTSKYRATEQEYRKRANQAQIPAEIREFKALERTFAELANNEEWLSKNFEKTIRAPESAWVPSDHAAIADGEEHILRCLGAAVIMEWNSIPAKLRRELFDSASSMGELLRTGDLRGQIARFLHTHREHAPMPSTAKNP